MTRGDKIRNMTDEQLVEFAFENGVDDCFRFCKNKEECEYDMDRKELEEKCKQCMLEWIKEEERMNYQEAIEILHNTTLDAEPSHFVKAKCTAIYAMRQLQKYESTGMTPEDTLDLKACMMDVHDDPYTVEQELKDLIELQRYRKIGTLEEIRKVMEKQNECKNCEYKIYSDRISKLNNCNNCGLFDTCENRPEFGEHCRINCNAWRRKP